jgi:hypothetical protein
LRNSNLCSERDLILASATGNRGYNDRTPVSGAC